MSAAATVASFALREALRRRVFTIVAVLTLVFLALYTLGAWQAFRFVDDLGSPVPGVEPRVAVGATIFGLGMFSTLFLGAVLAVFLTLGVARGDAERGLVQPLLVRPLTRAQLLLGRAAGAAAVAAAYTVAVYAAVMLITAALGEWWPDRVLAPGLALALGVVIIAALSVAGSVFLGGTANGILVFMAFGAGLVIGLLGQIGHFAESENLQTIARVGGYVLPYEGLYRAALADITADTSGLTRLVVNLGILGNAEAAGPGLWAWSFGYLAAVLGGGVAAFRRRDL